jgi:hypothetical protein
MKNMIGLAVVVLAVLTCTTVWADCGCAPAAPVAVSAAYVPEAVPAPAPVYTTSYPVAAPVYTAAYPVAVPTYSAYYPVAPVYSAYYAPPVYSAYYPAPVVVARPVYAPAAVYYGAPYVVRPKVYVYGEPVRNFFRAVTP